MEKLKLAGKEMLTKQQMKKVIGGDNCGCAGASSCYTTRVWDCCDNFGYRGTAGSMWCSDAVEHCNSHYFGAWVQEQGLNCQWQA